MLTAWLGHEVYGVNALLPEIPRNTMVANEEDPEPDPVNIYNDMDFQFDDVLGFNPPTRPALTVIADTAPDSVDIGEVFKAGHVYGFTVGVGYYPRDVTRSKGRVDGSYVLRAVSQSLVRFNVPKLSAGYRELNDVKIVKLTKLSIQRVAGAVPESALMGIVFADGLVLNKAP